MENRIAGKLSKEEILKYGTTSYCSAIHSVQQYKLGNCPLSDVEAAISDAMEVYHKQFKDESQPIPVNQDVVEVLNKQLERLDSVAPSKRMIRTVIEDLEELRDKLKSNPEPIHVHEGLREEVERLKKLVIANHKKWFRLFYTNTSKLTAREIDDFFNEELLPFIAENNLESDRDNSKVK